MNPKQVSFILQKSIETNDPQTFDLVNHLNFDPDFQNAAKDGLLHTAIKLNHIQLLQKVMAQHPDLSLQDIDGNTSLHLSLLQGKIDIANILLDQGAVANIPNSVGKTAADIAYDNHQDTIYAKITGLGVGFALAALHMEGNEAEIDQDVPAMHLSGNDGDGVDIAAAP